MIGIKILKELENRNLKIEHAAGGSGANTMIGIAQLGGHSAFTGKIGFDPRGDQYRNAVSYTHLTLPTKA